MTGNAAEQLRREMEGWEDARLYDVLASSPEQYRQWAASAELERRKTKASLDMQLAATDAVERMADSASRQEMIIRQASDEAQKTSNDTAIVARRTLRVLMWTLVATGLAAVGQIASVIVTLVRGH